jgi:GH15 family glucan-1,4-alpha-glucosidase
MYSNKLHAKKSLLNYGIVGNCKSSALIFEDSSINWCCLPQFDSSSVFGKILDNEIGGSFKINCDESFSIKQTYYKNTAILVTNFKNDNEEFELIDYMPRFKNDDGTFYSSPEIHRILLPIKGNPKIKVNYDPKLEYSSGKTKKHIKKKLHSKYS